MQLSTTDLLDDERNYSGTTLNSVNPKYILRNYLCRTAIDAAEQGDFGEVKQLLKVMQCPFDEQPSMEKYLNYLQLGLIIRCMRAFLFLIRLPPCSTRVQLVYHKNQLSCGNV